MNYLPSNNFHQIYSHLHPLLYVLAGRYWGVWEACDRRKITLPAANRTEYSTLQGKIAEMHYALHSNLKDFYWTHDSQATIVNVLIPRDNLSGFSSQPCRKKEVSQHPIDKSLVGKHRCMMNPSLQIFQYYFSDSGINSKIKSNMDLNKWI